MNFSVILLGMIGPGQIIIIIFVIVLLFGGRKIPELMKGLGQGIKEFKNASKEIASENGETKPEEKKFNSGNDAQA